MMCSGRKCHRGGKLSLILRDEHIFFRGTRAKGRLGEGIPASRTSHHRGMDVRKSTVHLDTLKC